MERDRTLKAGGVTNMPTIVIQCPSDKACEYKCETCGEHPAKQVIKNKFNGNELRICDDCRDYIKSKGLEK